jgi:hypothetical protein
MYCIGVQKLILPDFRKHLLILLRLLLHSNGFTYIQKNLLDFDVSRQDVYRYLLYIGCRYILEIQGGFLVKPQNIQYNVIQRELI